MLVISRKTNETITIEPISGLEPGVTLERAFLAGPIEIRLISISGGKVRLAIEAPKQLKIWRGPHLTAEAQGAETPAQEARRGAPDPARSEGRGPS